MIEQLKNLFSNYVLIATLVGWFFAQFFKMIITLIKDRKFKPMLILFSSGGMPSSHTATVSALFAASAIKFGFGSFEFAISFILAMVVMTDAVGVRRETGRQAEIINQILRDVLINGKPISDKELKELVGHKPIEVFGGMLVGLAVAGLYILYLTNH